jgi:hypothetical protein
MESMDTTAIGKSGELTSLRAHVIVVIIQGLLEAAPEIYTSRETARQVTDEIVQGFGYEDYEHYLRVLREEEDLPKGARNPVDWEVHLFEDVEIKLEGVNHDQN